MAQRQKVTWSDSMLRKIWFSVLVLVVVLGACGLGPQAQEKQDTTIVRPLIGIVGKGVRS